MRLHVIGVLVVAVAFLPCVAPAADFPYEFQLTFDSSQDPGKDSSGNGNDGILTNDAAWTKNGRFGGGIELGGGQDYVEVVIDVAERNFTMALWIKTDAPDVGVYSVLDGAAGAGGHDRHFYLQAGNICFRVWQGGGWCTSTDVADGEWHHITLVTEDGEGQTVYVDGDEVGENAYDHSDFDWQKRVWIGFSNDAARNYFEGTIDEAVYIAEPLDSADINTLVSGYAVEAENKLATTWAELKQ